MCSTSMILLQGVHTASTLGDFAAPLSLLVVMQSEHILAVKAETTGDEKLEVVTNSQISVSLQFGLESVESVPLKWANQ